MPEPIYMCVGCFKQPHEVEEYVHAAKENSTKKHKVSPAEYLQREEGTFNRAYGTFYCTDCYIGAGMPLGRAPAPTKQHIDKIAEAEIKAAGEKYTEAMADLSHKIVSDAKRRASA